jgi:hypothetical protein
MSGASPLNRDYATFHFPQEGEEHLVPRHLFRSKKIDQLIHESHDNSITIDTVASSAFSDLVQFLSGKQLPSDKEHLDSMLKAAHELELSEDVTQELTQLFWHRQVEQQRKPGLPPSK